MRAALVLIAGACLLAATACTSNAGPPPSASRGDATTRDSQPPCLGTADGDCPSGNPMQDF